MVAIAYQKIYQSPFKDRFDFSEQAERIRRARDLELLEEALKTRKAAELAAAYDLLKDEIVMSQQELQPLAVVAAFTQALSNGPDEAITAAYQVLQTSVYRTAFDLTDSEKQRLKEALTQAPPPSAEEVNPPKPAALVNNNPIYEATLTKACIITGPYIQYRLQQLPYVEYSASNLEEKMDLQAQSEHLNDRRLVLEVLIDNWLIGFETERLRREGVVFFLWDDKAAANFEATFKDFKAFILNKYPEVVTEKQITDHDLKIFLDIFFRRHSFIRYLRNLPQPMALNKWIGAQRKNATIKYPNEEEKKRFTGGLMIPKFRRDQKPETQS